MGGGDNLQFYPNFQHWGGMNLDHDFFQVSELSEDHKEKVFTRNGTLFSPNSGEDEKNVSTRNGTLFFPEFQ